MACEVYISNVFSNSGTLHISAVVSTRGLAYVRYSAVFIIVMDDGYVARRELTVVVLEIKVP